MQFLERIDRNAETAPHVRRGGLTERGQPQLKRIAAHRGILQRACQRFHRNVGRREIGVACPDIDHIHTLLDQTALDRRQLGHRIAR